MSQKRQDLNEIHAFIQIVKSHGVAKAASALGIPKSTISRKLSSLEERLGLTLIQRTTRQLKLTRSGQLYFDVCDRSLREIEQIERENLSLQNVPQGLIRLSTPAEVDSDFARLIAKFRKLYPLVELEIIATNQKVNLVTDGYDLVLRAGILEDSNLKSKKIGEGSFVLVAAPDYVNSKKKLLHPKDLKECSCILFAGRSDPHRWRLTNGNKTVDIKVSPVISVSSASLAKQLAIEGCGYAFLPMAVVRASMVSGELTRVLPDWTGMKANFYILYPESVRQPIRVRLLIDFISTEMKF